MNDEKHFREETINSTETENEKESEVLKDIHKLKQEFEDKTKEAEEYLSMLQRLQADFENYKKRVEKERIDIITYAVEDVIIQLLPIIDNLERAIESGRDQEKSNNAFLEGVDMILNQILELLEKLGVKEIEALDKEFDPHYHEAVMRVQNDDYPDNTIIEVLQKGYIMKAKVIRPSMVKVVINN